ncbi:palmitoyltransferase akr1 [Coemansia javaensis]|uniref:Palmitoyltransferase n=1 Tax=Coemansia javaensis TaxID=2761396 RepID=A0A9W8H8R5_9FUNG|nr:palmitoyltransferase akr1 [Coemansia javaensis]
MPAAAADPAEARAPGALGSPEAAAAADGSSSSNEAARALARPHVAAPKAAALSEVTAEVATGTVRPWTQTPDAGSPAQQQPDAAADALFEAARRCDLVEVRRLIEEGGESADKVDASGSAVLHNAIIGGSLDVIRYLVEERRANINVRCRGFDAAPLFWAISHQRLDIVMYLVDHGANATLRDSNQNTVLHVAAHADSVAIALFLASDQFGAVGGMVDAVDIHGMTALMWASYRSRVDMMELLVRLGASVNAQDAGGKTPLHFAMMNGIPSARLALLMRGADPGLKDFGTDGDNNGAQSPRDIAVAHGYADVFDSQVDGAAGIRDRHGPSRTVLGRSLRKEIAPAALPLAGVWLALAAVALYPWFVGVPAAILVAGGMQYCVVRFVARGRRSFGIMGLPYTTAVFQSSALYILITWLGRVLPATTGGRVDGQAVPTHRLLNVVFVWLFGGCMYCFYYTVFADPGYTARNESVRAAAAQIRRLGAAGRLDTDHFCIECLSKRPLRSKHCKYSRRCVARFDHYCPWTHNAIGLGNHRHFVGFLALLAAGIGVYVAIVRRYMESAFVVYDPIPGRPCYLGSYACGLFQAEPWVMVSTLWIALNCVWVSVLLASHLFQIATGRTTNEMLTGFLRLSARGGRRGHAHAHGGRRRGLVRRAATRLRKLAIGLSGSVPDDDQGAGPAADPGAESPDEVLPQNRAAGQSAFALQRIGYSQLLDSDGAEKLRSDPYNFGVVDNCLEFWTLAAEGRLAGTDWREAMDAADLAPYRPPQVEVVEQVPPLVVAA